MGIRGVAVRSILAVAAVAAVAACASQPKSQQTLASDRAGEVALLKQRSAVAIDRAKRENPVIKSYFLTSAGYVVFPKIAKGGFGIGGAHGNGVVYEIVDGGADRAVGTAEITQGSIGLQIGGQTFSEIIFFQDTVAMEHFKRGNAEISAAASGVAGGEGASAAAKYDNGVAVFIFGEQGLMGEASVGGQGFSYRPID